jgi:hypothetical protein
MKVNSMSEPISGAAASAVGLKALGGLAAGSGIAAGLASVVVMSMTHTQDPKEWRVALISTVVSSIGGGCALIRYLGIQNWAADWLGLIGLGGIMFACGLPGWALVRALFAYLNKRRDADITQIITDGAEVVKAVKDAI